MSRFISPGDLTSPIEREMERFYRQQAVQNSQAPQYLINGSASFAPPPTNIVQNLFAKPAEHSIALGDGAGALLNSGFGLLARQAFPLSDADMPIRRSGDTAIMYDGNLKPVEDLKGSDYFDALSPATREVLKLNNVSPDQFNGIETMEDAQERYSEITRRIELRQKIVRFNEVHPHYATLTGVLDLALEIVTDPVNIATIGTGSLLKGGATAGARATISSLSRNAGKAFVDDGFRAAASTINKTIRDEGLDLVPALIKDVRESNRVAAHTIASIAGGAEVASFDALSQYAEYRSRVDSLGVQEGFTYDWMRGGVSVTLGVFLSNLGALQHGRTPKVPTVADVIADSPTSLIGERFANKARVGSAAADAKASLLELDVFDRADRWSQKMFNATQYGEIRHLLEYFTTTEDLASAAKTNQASPSLVDTRGGGKQYHGTKTEITSLSEGYYNDANIYGGSSTFYTTDAIDIASGYKRGASLGAIYEVVEKAPVKFYDMEMRRSKEDWLSEDFIEGRNAEYAVKALGDTPNLREIMDELRDQLTADRMSRIEIQEDLSIITEALESRGFGGMTHVGGLLTNKDRHTVKIYFAPESRITLKKISRDDFLEDTSHQPSAISTRTGEEISLADLGEFFSSAPTFVEARSFLKGVPPNGMGEVVKTPKLAQIIKNFKDNADRIGEITRKATPSDAELKELKSLRKKQVSLESARKELTASFVIEESAEGAALRSIIDDVPMQDIYDKSSDRLQRMETLIARSSEELPGATNGTIKKATVSVFDFLARVGSQGTLTRQVQRLEGIENNPIAQTITRLYGAFDSRVTNDHFTDASGQAVVTVSENMHRVALHRSGFIKAHQRIMKGKSEAERSILGAEVMQARAGTRDKASLSADGAELLKHVNHYYDKIGDMAANNGALRNKIDNYINIVLKGDITNEQVTAVSKKLGAFWHTRQYANGNILHRGTLNKIGITGDGGELVLTQRYGDVPVKVTDITDDDLALYRSRLLESLEDEARHAIERRIGRHKRSAEDPVAAAEARPAKYREDSRASRQIEQEFWMQDDVIALGIVATDLDSVMRSYERGMGAYTARQETMTEVFGEAGRFEDAVHILDKRIRAMDNTDPHKQVLKDALDNIQAMNDRTLGHVKRDATGLEKFIQPLVDLTAGAINSGIVVSMSPEILQSIVPRLFNSADRRLLMKHMREIFNSGVNKDDMLAFSYAHELERDPGRFFGRDAFDPESTFGRGARWWKNQSRILFGEAATTHRLKRLVFASYYGKTGRKLMKLGDKLAHLDQTIDPSDTKAVSAAARAAGFGGDAALARDVRRVGLHTAESRKALAEFKRVSPESLQHPDSAMKVALRTEDAGLREAMIATADKLRRLSRDHTDRIIVTRSAGTSLPDNDVLGSMVLQFLSYPSSWFNAFLKRETESPNHILAGYLGLYMSGEIMSAMMRDVAYRGKTPEEVLADWDENFVENSARVATRIPIMGAWNDIILSAPMSLITDDPIRLSGKAPAFSFAERSLTSSVGILRDVAEGKDVETSKVKNALRLFPVAGSPIGQMLIEAAGSNEE